MNLMDAAQKALDDIITYESSHKESKPYFKNTKNTLRMIIEREKEKVK